MPTALAPLLLCLLASRPLDKCKGGPISAFSADGNTKVELSEDRARANFFEKSEKGDFQAAAKVDLPDDMRGCGRLLVTPDGRAFFFVRTQGREESDARRVLFVRRDPAGGKPVLKKLGLGDFGIDPRTCEQSESHTRLPKAELGEKGDLLLGAARVSAQDGSVTREGK